MGPRGEIFLGSSLEQEEGNREQGVGKSDAGMALAGEDGLVAEDAVEGGAANGELAGGAELVSAIEVEDIFDVMPDDGVEGEILRGADGVILRENFGSGGEG